MASMTTADIIVESPIAQEVDTLFGIPGAHMYDFDDALARRRDRIGFITTPHEQGAGYMAYGYAKSSGRIGVYTVDFLNGTIIRFDGGMRAPFRSLSNSGSKEVI